MSEEEISVVAETVARVLEERVAAAFRNKIRTVVELIEADPHQWSTRPCATCRAVTALLDGMAFGCVRKGLVTATFDPQRRKDAELGPRGGN